MATIILDFDDTLFNTAQLKQDVFELAKSEFGISQEDTVDSYKDASLGSNYTFDRHSLCLKNRCENLDEKIFLDSLYNLISPKYTFPSIKETLKNLSKNHKLVLLTKGERDFQLFKLKGSGLLEIFDEADVHIVADSKAEFLKNSDLQGNKIYFFNDKNQENELIKNLFPHFEVVLVSPTNPLALVFKNLEI